MSVVHMINNNTSGCKNCMVLIRILVLHGMLNNVNITAKYVDTKSNYLADHLSRLRLDLFRKEGGNSFEKDPTPVPQELWPMWKIWLD